MDTPSKEDKLSYIASLLRELHKMAHEENLEMLCYFLSMAITEADDTYSNEIMSTLKSIEIVMTLKAI